jgi:hypothetical protein
MRRGESKAETSASSGPQNSGRLSNANAGAQNARGKAASLAVSQFHFRDGLQLHVAGAFINLADLGVPIELFNRILARETIAAE